MSKEKKIEEMHYEEAMQALEETIAALESDNNSLEESLALFERGQALSRRCADLLKQAELRIQVISNLNEQKDE